jgi:hypothetical protein
MTAFQRALRHLCRPEPGDAPLVNEIKEILAGGFSTDSPCEPDETYVESANGVLQSGDAFGVGDVVSFQGNPLSPDVLTEPERLPSNLLGDISFRLVHPNSHPDAIPRSSGKGFDAPGADKKFGPDLGHQPIGRSQSALRCLVPRSVFLLLRAARAGTRAVAVYAASGKAARR